MSIPLQRPLARMFALYGEDLTLNRSGSDQPVQPCFCAPMDNSSTAIYFDANETVGLLKPALIVYVEGDTPTAPDAGDVFTRDGRLWTVRKTQAFRLAGTIILILALCD